MFYKLDLTKTSNRFIEMVFRESMKDLSEFYGINWVIDTPKIVLLKDRKSINLLHAKRTEPWFVAWADYNMRTVFVLDKKGLEKYSSHKYSTDYYSALIKHEVSHLFYRILSKGRQGPVWLSEGVAIYTSGQNRLKTKPSKLKNFLSFYEKESFEMYSESGFVVEVLVKRFGKNKLLELIKSLQKVSSENQFNKIFKQIYGFRIGYGIINKYFADIK